MRQSARIIAIFATFLMFTACTYSGNIKDDFFKPALNQNKLPIKAYFVWDPSLDS